MEELARHLKLIVRRAPKKPWRVFWYNHHGEVPYRALELITVPGTPIERFKYLKKEEIKHPALPKNATIGVMKIISEGKPTTVSFYHWVEVRERRPPVIKKEKDRSVYSQARTYREGITYYVAGKKRYMVSTFESSEGVTNVVTPLLKLSSEPRDRLVGREQREFSDLDIFLEPRGIRLYAKGGKIRTGVKVRKRSGKKVKVERGPSSIPTKELPRSTQDLLKRAYLILRRMGVEKARVSLFGGVVRSEKQLLVGRTVIESSRESRSFPNMSVTLNLSRGRSPDARHQRLMELLREMAIHLLYQDEENLRRVVEEMEMLTKEG